MSDVAVSKLQVGKGSKLWAYWTTGKGLARWLDHPHPWTALHDALIKEGVPAHMAAGLATNVFHAVTGKYPEHTSKKRESAMTIERRTAEILEVRAGDDGSRTADLRIVNYNVTDSYKTRFTPGVFTRSLAEGSIPAVWSHDPARPIGVVSDFRDGDQCLDGVLTFLPFEDVPDARMAYAAMKAGSIKGISFGFKRSADSRSDDDTDVRNIDEAALIEISPVLNPAVPGARTLAVRNAISGEPFVVSALTAADLITRFAAGQIDLAEALTALKENRTLPEEDAEADEEEVAAAEETEEETAATEEAETESTEDEEVEDEELPEELVGPVAEDAEIEELLARASGKPKPRTAAANGVYADPGLQADKKQRYPLGNKDQVIAAWRYINMPKNSKMYSSGSLSSIKGKIKSAAKKYGVNIAENDRKDKPKPTSGPDNTKSTGK